MPHINILPKSISELIAAGEVVERPASVIKELVENSIDAGASSITVEIQHGGTSFLRVTDNGCGIYHDDVPKAFISHATSKISTAQDLDAIYTLGFRGEALASVAAVSRVQVLTKSPEEDFGTTYSIEGGNEITYDEAGCPNGTTIIVRDIFYNVPARKKFLKKDVSEGNAVADIMDKLALSHPEISFRFLRDGKQIILTPGDNNLLSCVYSVFGSEFAKTLVETHSTTDGIKVNGLISKPSESRGSRAMQFFFINGRYVKSRGLMSAFENAYKNSIMVGKFPACVIFITLPADSIDINVHPTKTEVRFTDERRVNSAVYAAAKASVQELDTRPAFDMKKLTERPNPTASQYVMNTAEPIHEPHPVVTSQPKQDFWNRIRSTSFSAVNKVADSSKVEYHPVEDDEPDLIGSITPVKPVARQPETKKEEPDLFYMIDEEEKKLPEFRYIGEAFKTYLLVEFDKKLCLIDKHAAHERIIFNRLKSGMGKQHGQLLLQGHIVAVSKTEYDVIISNLDLYESAGFLVEDYGEGSVMVRQCPMMLDESDINEVVGEIADNILSGKVDTQSSKVDMILHTTACKAAIKAGNKNNPIELEELAREVCFSDDVRYCPHGRPVMIEMSEYDLEKQFRRIQN